MQSFQMGHELWSKIKQSPLEDISCILKRTASSELFYNMCQPAIHSIRASIFTDVWDHIHTQGPAYCLKTLWHARWLKPPAL